MNVLIRPARPGDLPALTDLYNHYVRSSPATFDLEPFSVEERQAWFDGFAAGTPHQLFVADEAGRICGFTYSGRFRPKAAYRTTVETTVYLVPEATGQGLGRRLYTALFEALRGQPLHRAYAGVTQPNPASVALHKAFGFEQIATFSEVGHKFGRYWDVDWFEKVLD